ncbi:hypothetical protein [Marinobacter sp. MCTG268]|uniref:hypothetical protein n=1 Tax=Marinobacter adhaerens TaxID=1033846 RepID=UPI00055A13C2
MPAEITEIMYAEPEPLSEFMRALPADCRAGDLEGLGVAIVSMESERRPLTPVQLVLDVHFWNESGKRVIQTMFTIEHAKELQHALLKAINEASGS